nr:long-chain fatty acid--CoA ligase [Micromonospora sp. DSM 115978]
EIVVTSGGKNVAPTPLEDRLRLHPLVSNAMVVGEARPFVTALVTVDAAAVTAWAASDGRPGTVSDWCDDPRLIAAVQSAVDDANSLVSRPESIRKFRLLATDFTVERGHLTPSMKLRRTAIENDFRDAVESLYS